MVDFWGSKNVVYLHRNECVEGPLCQRTNQPTPVLLDMRKEEYFFETHLIKDG
jgi:hypothetical protein